MSAQGTSTLRGLYISLGVLAALLLAVTPALMVASLSRDNSFLQMESNGFGGVQTNAPRTFAIYVGINILSLVILVLPLMVGKGLRAVHASIGGMIGSYIGQGLLLFICLNALTDPYTPNTSGPFTTYGWGFLVMNAALVIAIIAQLLGMGIGALLPVRRRKGAAWR